MTIVVAILTILLIICAIVLFYMGGTINNLHSKISTMTKSMTETVNSFNLQFKAQSAISDDFRSQIKTMTENARTREKQAVSSSRTIHVAKISEQMAPLLPDFPNYNLKDVQWIGGTIDIVVWDGLEEGRDVTVVFLDVKTGKAVTSSRQRKIQDAIEKGRVKFEVVRMSNS